MTLFRIRIYIRMIFGFCVRLRIRIAQQFWIRIHIKTYADPKHGRKEGGKDTFAHENIKSGRAGQEGWNSKKVKHLTALSAEYYTYQAKIQHISRTNTTNISQKYFIYIRHQYCTHIRE